MRDILLALALLLTPLLAHAAPTHTRILMDYEGYPFCDGQLYERVWDPYAQLGVAIKLTGMMHWVGPPTATNLYRLSPGGIVDWISFLDVTSPASFSPSIGGGGIPVGPGQSLRAQIWCGASQTGGWSAIMVLYYTRDDGL